MRMQRSVVYAVGVVLLLLINVAFIRLGPSSTASTVSGRSEGAVAPLGGSQIVGGGNPMIAEGRQTFRFDTFGDQAWWGATLHLYQAIEGAKLGGVGPGVSPKTALAVGLKVDLDALPAGLVAQIKAGKVNLDDPATTLALLKLNAVVGVQGFFSAGGTSLRWSGREHT